MDTHTERFPAPADTKAKTAKPRVRRMAGHAGRAFPSYVVSYRGVDLEVHTVIDSQKSGDTVAWVFATLPGYYSTEDYAAQRELYVIERAHKTFYHDPHTAVLDEIVGVLDEAAKFARSRKRAARAKPVQFEIDERGKRVTVELRPGLSVGIVGEVGYRAKDKRTIERTWTLGDTVWYDSYNLTYSGKIVSIGKKTITVEDHGRRKRLDPETFAFYNCDDDAEVMERNAEISWSI